MWKLLVLVFVAITCAEEDNFQNDVVLRIVPSSDAEIHLLKKWLHEGVVELDIWRDVSHPGANVDVHIKASDVTNVKEMLTKNNIKFSLMIDNLQQVVDEEQMSNQKNAYASGFDYDIYNNYFDIQNELKYLAQKYRAASTFNVGQSYEGQDMIGIKISTGGSKPVIWLDGGIHAREWISPATMMFFVNYLLTSGDPNVATALQKYEFQILPVFNVDGYRYTHKGGRARMWRKTRTEYGGGWRKCYGADPNRNWGYKWGGEGTSSDPCRDTYRGPYAWSEKCVQNVKNHLENIRNLKSYWNVHAYSQLLLIPWAYRGYPYPKDVSEMRRVGNIFAKRISQRYGTYYRVGPPSEYLYNAAGGSMDWTYATLGVIYSYSPELRDKGARGFILPANQIRPSGKLTSVAILSAVNALL